MPKPSNRERRELIHVAIPLAYHSKLKAQVARDGSNITATVNALIENYLIENGCIKKQIDRSIFAD